MKAKTPAIKVAFKLVGIVQFKKMLASVRRELRKLKRQMEEIEKVRKRVL